MGDVGGVDPAHPLAAQVDHLAVGQRARRAVGLVVERDQHADVAVHDLGLRRDAEPLVHGAALVGLEVAERDVPQRSSGR